MVDDEGAIVCTIGCHIWEPAATLMGTGRMCDACPIGICDDGARYTLVGCDVNCDCIYIILYISNI